MNRRTFLQTGAVGVTTLVSFPLLNAFAAQKPNWAIGCFNRPWTKWSYDDALDGISAAGYKLTGLLTPQRGEAFTSSAATPEYLGTLKKRITQRGLAVNTTVVQFKPGAPLAENIADLRKQIENAARLELACGIDDMPEQRLAGELVQDLGAVGVHPLALPGGENDYVELHRADSSAALMAFPGRLGREALARQPDRDEIGDRRVGDEHADVQDRVARPPPGDKRSDQRYAVP